jgi:hypothetical protein
MIFLGPTHNLPDTRMVSVSGLIDTLVLRHLVGGVDEATERYDG